MVNNQLIEELKDLEFVFEQKNKNAKKETYKLKKYFVFYSSTLDNVCICKLNDIKRKRYEAIKTISTDDFLTNGFSESVYDTKFMQRIEKFMEKHKHSALDIFMNTGYMKYEKDRNKIIIRYILWYYEFPFIEQLIKAGFSDLIFCYIKGNQKNKFKQAFKQASDIQGITGLTNSYYSLMKEKIVDPLAWNNTVDLIKSMNVKESTIKNLLNLITNPQTRTDIPQTIMSIMQKKEMFEDCEFYTIDSLISYVDKCRSKQGLKAASALRIIDDYLSMCAELNIIPIIKNENLEKDHDVLSVIYNKIKEEETERIHRKGFERQSKRLKKFEFEDNRLKVVIPTSVSDLFEEGRNNHNCVASYVDKHANGTTDIFFIRNKKDIKKSYITIELDEANKRIRQAYYSQNRHIDNKDDLKFIDNWLEKCFTN